MDATPLRLGQEVSGFARQLELSVERAEQARDAVRELPIGGTAVGSGINTHPEFGRRVSQVLAQETGIPLIEAANHFEANAQRDALVSCYGQLRTIAATLFNVANNIRWLGSGPRCSFSELKIADLQPGSSIMPGKVNPVMCEAMMMVAARVMGNHTTVTIAGQRGNFELNVMMPVLAQALLESITLLSNVARTFADRCVAGIEANEARAKQLLEKNPSIATALNPSIGYDKATEVAKEAAREGLSVRDVVERKGLLTPEEIDAALNVRNMTEPGLPGS
jgi:fumarate hydratase class II